MHDRKRRLSARALALLVGSGAAAVAVGAGQAGSTPAPLRCEILADATSGAVALEGMVHTDVAVSGSYRFRVASTAGGGSSNIQQGGDFSAVPGSPVTLGRVLLGNPGAIYDAHLEVTANGMSVTCAERVGGAI